ncbi:hypothetical protein [Enterococcus mundtii]|uniref:SAM-dependent methyltransferases n=1 Tax=Enterococcus mundtii TaxID=53346 RepID=A0AAI8R6P5_ENTMU|nr:hypothetical protein [Enterococcus mundtii]MBE9911419.1 hypothetical protein [Enterococcus mundtii]MCA6774294.1 hypothetical protein [Enterococcus mundtii]MRI72809.1 hypothetical protein [Enterococcus mundtii]QCJ56376.1 hypothetical protein DDJ96_07080 [Enterococcus mundtii]UBM06468.1 hypothetical protein K9N66_04770 [Enterococcus mundtii]
MRNFILYQFHRLFNTNTYREMLFQRINEAIYSTYHAANYPKSTGENEMERLAKKLKRSERRKNLLPKLGDPLYKKPSSRIYVEDLQLKISPTRLEEDPNFSYISRQSSTNSLPDEHQTYQPTKPELMSLRSKVKNLSPQMTALAKANDPSTKELPTSRKEIPRVRRTQSDYKRY